jgi:hypothetical protein
LGSFGKEQDVARSETDIKAYLLAAKRDYWERLKRNKAYQADYSNFSKLRQKINHNSSQNIGKIDELRHHLGRHYHLSSLLDPAENYSDQIILEVILSDECWIEDAQNDWDGNPKKLPIKDESFMKVTSWEKNHTPIYKPRTRMDLLVEGKYLRLLIDINLPLSQIKAFVTKAVTLAEKYLKDNNHRKVKLLQREKYHTNLDAYRVWDLKKNGLTFEKAWLEISPNEKSMESAKSKAAQHFTKAELLINSLGKNPIFGGTVAFIKKTRPDLFSKK